MAGLSDADREKVSLFVDEMRAQREQRGWSREELAPGELQRLTDRDGGDIPVRTDAGPGDGRLTGRSRRQDFASHRRRPWRAGHVHAPVAQAAEHLLPESFRPYAEHETRHPSCACSSTRWCQACSRPKTTHLAAGLSCGSEETCAECGTPNSPRNSRKTVGCAAVRPAVRRRRLEARIAAGDLKRCSRCQQGKPLTEYPTENSFCRACKSAATRTG